MKEMATKGKKKAKKALEGALGDAVKKKKKEIEAKLEDDAEEAEFLRTAYPSDIKARDEKRAREALSKEKAKKGAPKLEKKKTKKEERVKSRAASPEPEFDSALSARSGESEPKSPTKQPSR